MADGKQDDTNEKILMKDHDILIALHTQNQELIRRVDSLSIQLSDNQKNNYLEFKAVAVSQTKLEGDVEAIQKKDIEQDKRMDTMDTRWKVGDIAVGIGTVLALILAWFK